MGATFLPRLRNHVCKRSEFQDSAGLPARPLIRLMKIRDLHYELQSHRGQTDRQTDRQTEGQITGLFLELELTKRIIRICCNIAYWQLTYLHKRIEIVTKLKSKISNC